MKSKCRLIKAIAFLIFFILSISSCGSVEKAIDGIVEDAISKQQSASGFWGGDFTSHATSQTSFTEGIVTQNNDAYFITESGIQYVGTISVKGNKISGNLSAYAPAGMTFPDGNTNGSISINGTVIARGVMIGTYSGVGDTGSFSLVYSSLYERPSSISTVSDNWAFSTFGYSISLSIDSSGNISGSDLHGCAYTGTIRTIHTSYNAYEVEVDVTSCGTLNGNYTGLATLVDNITTNDTLIVGVADSQHAVAYTLSRQ
jgi:hypothetical protein